MTQSTKKSLSAGSHHQKPPLQALEAIKKTEESIVELEREGVEKIIETAGDLHKVATECATICSDNLYACIESGNKATHALQNITGEAMESCNRTLSNIGQISKDALACRSLDDVVELQNSVMQQSSDYYFTMVKKFSGMLFDLFSQAMEPFRARMAHRN